MSLRLQMLNAWLRRFEKPALSRVVEPEVMRQRFELNARLFFHAPRGTQLQWQVLEAEGRRVDVLDVVPAKLTAETVLLYVHGSAFLFGSPKTHVALAANIGMRLGARTVMPRYRLAPENPFPAAFDDLRTTWNGLRASGVPADQIVLGGDSAGGALALALLGQLVKDGAPLPAAAFGLSPLVDLTFSGESFRTNAAADAVLPAERAQEMAIMYLSDHDPKDPCVSPLFAPMQGACPVWLTVGDTEILRDDSRRMAAHLRQSGVAVTLEERANLPHVWPIFHNVLPEARETLDTLSAWLKRQAPGSQAEN